MNAETVTNYTAGAAIFSPVWLPSFDAVSAAAAKTWPLLGCAWIALQIGIKLYDRYRRKR